MARMLGKGFPAPDGYSAAIAAADGFLMVAGGWVIAVLSGKLKNLLRPHTLD